MRGTTLELVDVDESMGGGGDDDNGGDSGGGCDSKGVKE